MDPLTSLTAVPVERSDSEPFFLPEPSELEDVGINPGLLLDLVLKEIYFERTPTASGISRALALPFGLTEGILDAARSDSLIHTVRSGGYLESQFQYGLTERGEEKVKECLARSQYRGPVPVPLAQYYGVVRKQSVRNQVVTRERLQSGLGDLVLSEEVLDQVGPGINSGQSIFLYGASGNGKTSIATHLRNVISGLVLVPHAIEINGQIIKVLDPAIHEVKADKHENGRAERLSYLKGDGPDLTRDRRWAICSRPVIIVGGELTMEELEFQYDAHLRYHQAPLHMKAAGGLLVIDDFGRQRVPPRDLLNRWIVPMDRGVDYLPLPTGESIEVPFDLLLIFSTNLHPLDVVDEAFLRRLRHKVFVPNPTPKQFGTLMFNEASARGLDMSQEFVDHIIDRCYRQATREMRCCHARDILANVDDIRRYEGDASPLTLDILVRAAEAYFRFAEDRARPRFT